MQDERSDLVNRVPDVVVVRGRETRPTAPVPNDSAERVHKSEGIPKTMAIGEEDRRREARPSAPEEVPTAHWRSPEGGSTL